MFCSKCGKTLKDDALQCPFCGLPVGESRFTGSPYTSAQAHVLPGAPASAPTEAYTRTTYTGKGDASDAAATDARTTYRPVFDPASIPEEMRRDMRAEEPEDVELPENLSDMAIETLQAVDEELRMESVDLSQFKSREIRSEGRAGISSDVSEYIQKLETDQTRRSTRRQRRATYDDYADEDAVNAADPGDMEDLDGDEVYDDDQSEVFDDIDEEEFEELRHSSFGLMQILKIAIALVVVAALFVGGVMWFRYIRGNQSSAPIEGVSEALYTDGLTMLKANAADANVSDLLTLYTSDGILALNNKLSEAKNGYAALLPAEPAANDQLFLSALTTIQDNISNSITMDALSTAQTSETALEDSQARWAIVDRSIQQLEAATTAAELTAILNGEQIEVKEPAPDATPTPTPSVNYNTLSKGDKSDEVLEMQNRLYELGYLLDSRDGDFGTKTQTAVKLFQNDAGLEATGIANSETLAILYSDDAPRTQYAQPTPTPTAEPTPEPTPEPVDSGTTF